MFAVTIQLLLHSGDKTLEYWILAVVWWIPQLIWIGLAVLLLYGVMLRLRRFCMRWMLMWIPYAMIAWLMASALSVRHWDYTRDNPLNAIA